MRTSALLPLLFLIACSELRRAPSADMPDDDPPATGVAPTYPNAATREDAPAPPPLLVQAPDAGPDADEPIPAAAGEKAKRICQAYCETGARCQGDASSAFLLGCMASCQPQWAGRAPHLREDFVSYAEQCYETLSCVESKATCLKPWSAIEYPEVPVVRACTARKSTCHLLDSTECADGLAYDEPTRGLLTLCFSRPCPEIDRCLATARGD